MNSTTLEIPSYFIVSQEQFELLANANRDLRLERSPKRELMIIPSKDLRQPEFPYSLIDLPKNPNEDR
jgi:hypothetical protein